MHLACSVSGGEESPELPSQQSSRRSSPQLGQRTRRCQFAASWSTQWAARPDQSAASCFGTDALQICFLFLFRHTRSEESTYVATTLHTEENRESRNERTTDVSHTDSSPHCHVLWLRCELAQHLPRVRVPKPVAQQLLELFHTLLRFPTNELGHLSGAPSCASTLQPALRVEYRAAADASNRHTLPEVDMSECYQ